jgi:hypothetical protein
MIFNVFIDDSIKFVDELKKCYSWQVIKWEDYLRKGVFELYKNAKKYNMEMSSTKPKRS